MSSEEEEKGESIQFMVPQHLAVGQGTGSLSWPDHSLATRDYGKGGGTEAERRE